MSTASGAAPPARSAPRPPPAAVAPLAPAAVVRNALPESCRLSDGNTFAVLGTARREVRLSALTPRESVAFRHPRAAICQCAGVSAGRNRTRKRTRSHGRLVGEVRYRWAKRQSGAVKAGLAWWYKRYAPTDTLLAQLEAAARAAQRGLWSEPQPCRRGKAARERGSGRSVPPAQTAAPHAMGGRAGRGGAPQSSATPAGWPGEPHARHTPGHAAGSSTRVISPRPV